MRAAVLFLVALAVGAILSALALRGLRFDHDTRSLQRVDAAADELEDELARTFGSDDVLMLAWGVESAVDRETFRHLRRVTEAVAAVEGVEDIYSIASDKVPVPMDGGLRPVTEEDLATEEGRAGAAKALRAAAVYVGTVYNEQLDVVAVVGTIRPGPRDAREATLREVRALAGALELPDRPIHVAGVTALAVEAGEYAVADVKRIGGLALAVAVLVLLALCGDLRETLVAVVATGLPPLFALGLASLLGLPVTALGAALFPVLAVVGITSSVHLLNAYGEERRRGRGAREAAFGAARKLAPPIALSLSTTALAFFSLQATGVPAFRAGGNIVGLGVLTSIPVVLIGLPAGLALVRPPLRREPARRLDRPLLGVALWVARRTGVVLAGGLLVCVAGVWLAAGARVEVAVLQAFRADSTIARTYRFLDERLTATVPVDVVLSSRAEVTEVLAELRRFTDRVSAEPGVESVQSLLTLVEFGKSVSPLGDAGALLVLRGLYPHITRRFEDLEGKRYRIKIRVREGTPPEVLDRLGEAVRDLGRGEAQLMGLYARAVGTTRSLLRDIAFGAALMTALVLVTVAGALRSWRLAVAALAPNLLPPAVVFGGAALVGMALDISAVAVAAGAIGLAVDDTFHVVFRLGAEVRAGRPVGRALLRTQRSVGRALVLSTLVLMGGLLCLGWSTFVPTARFGLFTAAACGVALLGDLLLLPAVVRVMGRI